MTPVEAEAYMRKFFDALKQAASKEEMLAIQPMLDGPAFQALPDEDAMPLLVAYNHRWVELSGFAFWS